MSYIDVFIPFAIGLYMLYSSASLAKKQDPQYHKSIKLLKICGWGLLGVACLYLIIKIYS
jgi:hypothetical protein